MTMESAEKIVDKVKLDFTQAKAKHLLFKSKLKSMLYGMEMEETPLISHYECAVGKWIYGHALNDFGHIPEMHELEKVHSDIHLSARKLIALYKSGNIEEARKGLEEMELIADHLIGLLSTVELKVQENTSPVSFQETNLQPFEVNMQELQDLQRLNQDLDKRIREQSKEIYEAKERFELVAKATHDAVWDWNLLTNKIWWNENYKELFGYPYGDMGERLETWRNSIHPEDREKVIQGIQKIIDQGEKQWAAEYRFRKADGTYSIVYDRGYVLHHENNKPFRMVGSLSDITERKKSELELAATNRRLQLALDAGKLGSYELDLNSGIIECSTQCKSNLGLSLDATLDLKGLYNIILPEDRKGVEDAIQHAISNDTDYSAEYRVVWPDGSIQWIYASGLVIRNTERLAVQIGGVTVNISKQKLFEQELSNEVKERTRELAQANKELSRSNVNLEEFAYAASHDMKEPIRKIHFFADLIKSRLKDKFSKEEISYFERMEAAAKRMGYLIDDLLSYSQVSIRPRQLELVDLNEIMNEVITDLELEIEEKKATIHFHQLPVIQGHHRQIQQAFQNLISNAVKFQKPGCSPGIIISCKETLGNHSSFHLSKEAQQKNFYQIAIQDNGIGFDPLESERIFNVFTRLHGNSAYKGTGVGLSIVRKVVENHGGYVMGKSELGKGAAFILLLPK